MNKFLTTKNFYLVIALLSALTLAIAIYIEYVLEIKPCKLCLYQRVPYLFAILICFIGFRNLKNNLWIYFLSLTFLISFFLSIYHTGIENNIFDEFSGCIANDINITNKDDLLKSLSERVTSCKDVAFRIFGLSLATINALISALILIISIIIIKNEKNR